MSNISVPNGLEGGQVEGCRVLDIRDVQREMRDGHFCGPVRKVEGRASTTVENVQQRRGRDLGEKKDGVVCNKKRTRI